MLSQRTTSGPGAALPTPAVSASPTTASDRDETHRRDYTSDSDAGSARRARARARSARRSRTCGRGRARRACGGTTSSPASGPFVDGETDELDAEAASAVLLEHVDVGEVRLHVPVRERPREADLLVAVVEADDASRAVDEIVLHLSRPPFRPVRARRDSRAPHRGRSAPDRRRARSRRRGRASYGQRAQAEAAVELVRGDDDRRARRAARARRARGRARRRAGSR